MQTHAGHVHATCEFIWVHTSSDTDIEDIVLGVLYPLWLLQPFPLLFRGTPSALRGIFETSHLWLRVPKCPTLCAVSACGSLFVPICCKRIFLWLADQGTHQNCFSGSGILYSRWFLSNSIYLQISEPQL